MNKIEHLKLIQEVISRLSDYSNTIKSWTVSLVTITVTLWFSINEGSQIIIALIISLIIALLFLILDCYYYMLERSFRNLFNRVRSFKEEDIDFRMDFKDSDKSLGEKYQGLNIPYYYGFKSPSILILYGPIILGDIIAIIVLLFIR